MLPKQRHAIILDRVRQDGGVRVSDLVEALGVSDMTIRRDLDVLADRGLIDKVHGGATAVDLTSTSEPGFEAKAGLQLDEKQAIAAAVRSRIAAGAAVAIGAGTTTHGVAQALVDLGDLTVVTNSIPVAEVFHAEARSDQTVILTGGIRTPSNALVGPVAVGALRSLHVDVAIIGVHGMEQRSGFTTPNLHEAETDRALIESAQRVIVVADHTKWGVVGISTIAEFEEVDVLVSDERLATDATAFLEDRVGELVLAPVAAVRAG